MKWSDDLLLAVIANLPDNELMELGKPIDDVDMEKLPVMKKLLGIDYHGE